MECSKAILRRKFTVLNVYQNRKVFKNDLSCYLRKLERDQIKSENKKKKIIKIKVAINQTEKEKN